MARLGARLVVIAVLSAGVARADAGALRVDLRRDLALTAAAAAAAIGIGSLAPASHCLICSSGGLDHEAREVLRLESPIAMRAAGRASDRIVSLVMPAGALVASGIAALRDGAPRELLEDAVVVAQAALIAADVNALVKRTAGRPRPGEVAGVSTSRSFYSSHTSRAFALAVSTATVATLRGRRSARWLWIAGLTLSTGVGYLRVASDAHWLTDVAAGAVAGSAIGFSVPWFLHRGGRAPRLDVMPAPGGIAVAF